MLQRIRDWWYDRIIKNSEFTDSEWGEAFQSLKVLKRLQGDEKKKLKRLATLFLHYKSLEGVGEIEITNTHKLIIALQACLPILNLGLDWYNGWVSVIIYPGAYSRKDDHRDEFGIVHEGQASLSGESWQRGPVILSWDDILHRDREGSNLVIHEFAHKLDMLNGSANGHPPLHKDMSIKLWSEVFNHAYADFRRHLGMQEFIPIDSYAATSPAEFFAVFSEVFFENPSVINNYYPEIYRQLAKFYRQDPLLQIN